MVFCPNSSELMKNNVRNIIPVAVLIFQKFFDFDQNAYSRTGSCNPLIIILFLKNHKFQRRVILKWHLSVRKTGLG